MTLYPMTREAGERLAVVNAAKGSPCEHPAEATINLDNGQVGCTQCKRVVRGGE